MTVSDFVFVVFKSVSIFIPIAHRKPTFRHTISVSQTDTLTYMHSSVLNTRVIFYAPPRQKKSYWTKTRSFAAFSKYIHVQRLRQIFQRLSTITDKSQKKKPQNFQTNSQSYLAIKLGLKASILQPAVSLV